MDTNTGLIRQSRKQAFETSLGTVCGTRSQAGSQWREVDLLTISELMGHKTMQMTMRYAHLAQEHNLEAVDCLYLPKTRSREKQNEVKQPLGSQSLVL